MSFKFTLFGIETGSNKVSKCSCNKPNLYPKNTMGKTKHQKRFGKAVSKCHAKTKTPKTFGKCMRKELKK